ncbi:MAG: acyl-CoA dehydrogenase family protein [Pseudomonadota bacterium]
MTLDFARIPDQAHETPDAIAFFADLATDLGQDWRRAWRRACKAGFLRLLDGDPEDALDGYLAAMFALGEGCRDNGFTMGLNSHLWTVQQPIARFGSEAQKQAYLTGLADGTLIGAYAQTEAMSGSDAMALQTHAEKTNGGWLLNGSKTYIGMGPVCDVALVFAKTAPEKKAWGISVFIVKADDAGFRRGADQEKIGLTTLPMGSLSFENCWIPEDRLLGREGAGAQIFQATLDWERAFILTPHVGAMTRQLRDCAAFAQTRETFGKAIIEHQSVANRIADMAVRLETSRLMVEQAAAVHAAGKPLTALAAMTNLHVSEAFVASSADAVRTFGGAGYLADAQAGQDLRDAYGGVIYSGTSDLQRQIIARLTAHKAGMT